jgi:hypothetical protein
MVKYLVENGADIDAEYGCAFRWAADQGCPDVVKYIWSQRPCTYNLFFKVGRRFI